jgi:hypothetical protein
VGRREQTKVLSNRNPNSITVRAEAPESEESRDEAMAKVAMSPEFQAALTLRSFAAVPKDDLAANALIDELAKQCAEGSSGNLSRGESMLVAQAHALDAIFGECARRARTNMGELPHTVDIYLRQAMRAQSNCRATWETLANMKNPRNVAFVRQTNIAAGPQQVNNGAPPSRTEETGNTPNKLLEANHGERLDARASGKASGADPQLETVEAINRPKD